LAPQDDPLADANPTTQPEVQIEVVDSLTDPIASVQVTGERITQVAEPAQRPAAPGTEFVHQVASGSLDMAELDALPELPSTPLTRDTARTPHERRIRRLTYGLVTAGLLSIIGVSIYEIERLSTPEEAGTDVDTDTTRLPERESSAAPAITRAERPASLPDELPDRGKKAPRVLTVEVEQVFADEHTESFKLGDELVATGAVTVVNLWATWCEPCKRELPGFRDMFAVAGWEDEVRFVPILLDTKDPVWAFHNYSASMPKDAPFLVDPLQSAVVAALRGPELLQNDSGLPVTAVFDCRRQIRLLHVSELRAADFETLKTLLQQLRGELGTEFCKERRRVRRPAIITPPAKAATARCGNLRCEAGESAKNCCDCLECTPHQRCESPRSSPICVDKVDVLKD